MKTPWGKSYGSEDVAVGIKYLWTAGHGGYRVLPKKNAMIPEKWRLKGEFEGWYEEDCGWAPLAKIFPEAFPGIDPAIVDKTIEMWESWVEKSRKRQPWNYV
jgi:hypothetical protein